MEHNGLLSSLSFDFAVRIVMLGKWLRNEHKEYDLSRQLIRCGTSIGANIAESQGAQSVPDFIAKLHISLKESREAEFWLKLLYRTQYINDREYFSIKKDIDNLIGLLVTVLKSTKKRHGID